MKNKDKFYSEGLGEVMSKYYNKKLVERMTASNPFQTDIEVEEIVPKYHIRIPILFVRRSYFDYDYEWTFGFDWKLLFTLGKKKQKRFLMTYELSDAKEGKTITWKRYKELKNES